MVMIFSYIRQLSDEEGNKSAPLFIMAREENIYVGKGESLTGV